MSLHTRLLCAVVLAATVVVLGVSSASAATIQPIANSKMNLNKVVQTWAYAGPRVRLKGAKITIADRTGRVLQVGKTTRNGNYMFDLSRVKSIKLPLTITTSGGRLVTGRTFDGHLTSRVFALGLKRGVVQTSLISTAASKLATKRAAYARATARVRATLGIPKTAYPWVLGLGNLSVGYRQLAVAARRAGGFDALATDVAALAKAGKRLKGLRPASLTASGPFASKPNRKPRQSSTSVPCGEPGATSTCTWPSSAVAETNCGMSGLTSDSGTSSTELLTDVGTVAMSGLLKYAGAPSAAASSLSGMVFTAVGAGGTAKSSDVQTAYNYANCILEIVGAIENQLDAVGLTVTIATATSCQNQLTGETGWYAYQTVLGDADQFPIDSSNTALMGTPATSVAPAVTGYLTDWQTINTSCGNAIPNMLWGTASNSGGWPEMLAAQSAGGAWIGQAQVQNLQNFLSYWGSLAYYQFALQNEVYNWVGAGPGQPEAESAQILSGADFSQGAPYTNASGQTVCAKNVTASSPSYCAQANNIAQAYPADVYSDEIALMGTGITINTVPAGIKAPPAIPSPIGSTTLAYLSNPNYKNTSAAGKGSYSPTALNPAWFYNYYLNYTPNTTAGSNQLRFFMNGGTVQCIENNVGKCPMSTTAQTLGFDGLALDYFNGLGVNPNGYGSAVETYDNPQTIGRGLAQSADISALKSNGPGGTTSLTALYNAVNQTPNGGTGAWSSITSGQVVYFVQDSGYFTAEVPGDANLTWEGALGANKSGWENTVSDIPSTPVFSVLTKRTWWSGSATAQTSANAYKSAKAGTFVTFPLTNPPTAS